MGRGSGKNECGDEVSYGLDGAHERGKKYLALMGACCCLYFSQSSSSLHFGSRPGRMGMRRCDVASYFKENHSMKLLYRVLVQSMVLFQNFLTHLSFRFIVINSRNCSLVRLCSWEKNV